MLFEDRRHAGRILADRLTPYQGTDVVVLGLPRGGVPVAVEVARVLRAPLDVFIVRKLGVPGHEEYAMGAIAAGEVIVTDPEAAKLRIPQAAFDAVVEREKRELRRREDLYRRGRPALELGGRTVILVDDGLATGSTMKAAALAVRQHHPDRIIVAAPVGAGPTCAELEALADEVVCASTPEPFRAVGPWYRDFGQMSDGEVRALLDDAWRRQGECRPRSDQEHEDRVAKT